MEEKNNNKKSQKKYLNHLCKGYFRSIGAKQFFKSKTS